MRELKFRAWTRQNPPMPWSQKFVAMTGSGEQMIPIGGTFTGAWHVLGDDAEGLIIEQYTGLRDKNGKEIYEGDIVKYEALYEGERVKGKGVVNFGYLDDTDGWTNDGYLCWRIDDWLSLDYGGRWIEVVGNIHENPELLEEEE